MAKADIIKIVRYRTIRECLEAFFMCPLNQVPEGYWEWLDEFGKYHKQNKKEAIEAIKKLNAWGWVEEKEIVHIFVRKKASMRDLIEMLAHEIGHLQRPYHRTLEEEQKANKYSLVAITAYEIAEKIFNQGKNNHVDG